MVRFTADVLESAPSYLNPLKDRELDLRGLNAPAIENLGVTRDSNESIDATDNDIRHLGNFPKFPRLRTLLLSHNRISSVSPTLAASIPNLQHLIMMNNKVMELADLEPLSKLQRLQLLVLLGNPVCKRDRYRLFVIWSIKSLRILDYQRITQAERTQATGLFGTIEEPTALAAQIMGVKSVHFETGAGTISQEERRRIQQAIQAATSMEEVRKLELMLATGSTSFQ